jgi:hypothetical protein
LLRRFQFSCFPPFSFPEVDTNGSRKEQIRKLYDPKVTGVGARGDTGEKANKEPGEKNTR